MTTGGKKSSVKSSYSVNRSPALNSKANPFAELGLVSSKRFGEALPSKGASGSSKQLRSGVQKPTLARSSPVSIGSSVVNKSSFFRTGGTRPVATLSRPVLDGGARSGQGAVVNKIEKTVDKTTKKVGKVSSLGVRTGHGAAKVAKKGGGAVKLGNGAAAGAAGFFGVGGNAGGSSISPEFARMIAKRIIERSKNGDISFSSGNSAPKPDTRVKASSSSGKAGGVGKFFSAGMAKSTALSVPSSGRVVAVAKSVGKNLPALPVPASTSLSASVANPLSNLPVAFEKNRPLPSVVEAHNIANKNNIDYIESNSSASVSEILFMPESHSRTEGGHFASAEYGRTKEKGGFKSFLSRLRGGSAAKSSANSAVVR